MTASPDDHPFVIQPRQRRLRRPWLRPLVMLAVCVAGVYGAHEAAQQWLIRRLATDLSAHPPYVQIERLGMLAQFGAGGLPHVAAALASPDEGVSAAAFQILSDMQARWQTSRRGEAVKMNRAMVDALQSVLQDGAAECRHRVAELLNQTIVDTVDSDNEVAAEAYQLACSLLSEITGTDVRGPADAMRPVSVAPPGSLSVAQPDAATGLDSSLAMEPLPLGRTVRVVPGSHIGLRAIDRSDRAESAADDADTVAAPQDGPAAVGGTPPPSLVQIHRGSLTVTPVQAEDPPADEPLAIYETRSVIDFVGSRRQSLRDAAERELRKRGFDTGDLELATRLTSTDVRVRLAMVDELPDRTDVDPRKWLFWLAADAERDVRLQAISRLGTMDDPEVREALRERLQEERDPTVATRLRRFLGLR